MKNNNLIKKIRTSKIIQLSLLIVFILFFVGVLLSHPTLTKQIYQNEVLFILCAFTWILILFQLICLFIDFLQMRSFALESHALNRIAYLDNLTGIPNRHGLDVVFQTYDNPKSLEDVGCFMVTIDNLKSTNESLGHKAGDLLIQDFCSIFEEIGDGFGVVGRNGGNEFILVINHCTNELMAHFIHILNSQIGCYNEEHENAPLHIAYTYVLNSTEHATAFTQLLTATYNKLHS